MQGEQEVEGLVLKADKTNSATVHGSYNGRKMQLTSKRFIDLEATSDVLDADDYSRSRAFFVAETRVRGKQREVRLGLEFPPQIFPERMEWHNHVRRGDQKAKRPPAFPILDVAEQLRLVQHEVYEYVHKVSFSQDS